MKVSTPQLVLAYGTLKKGYRFHSYLHGSTFLGRVKTIENYTMVDLGHFPGVLRRGNGSIIGELYMIPPSALPTLDHVEGVPDVYLRIRTPTSKGPAWLYVLSPGFLDKNKDLLPTWPIIADGEWDPQNLRYRTEHLLGAGAPW